MSFKDYFNYDDIQKDKKRAESPETKFYEATGVQIQSLNAFVAYLILDKRIKSSYQDGKEQKSIWDLQPERLILYVVKNTHNIVDLAKNFAKKWKH